MRPHLPLASVLGALTSLAPLATGALLGIVEQPAGAGGFSYSDAHLSSAIDDGICPRDLWLPLWQHAQCPSYAVPSLVPRIPPTIVAPTPLPPEIPAIPDELESFEDWKRRKEAEDAPAPPAEDAPRQENSTAESEAPDSNSTANATADASPAPPPPSPKPGHRYNYASPDCSARVLQSSPQTQHASSLLHKSRDRYMLTPCRADEHWVVVELCDEIRIEAIELAVWEFFSGIVRGITVSVGDDANGQTWTQVGEFVGKNVRGAQIFTLPEPTSFHRFLRLDFESFYGAEYYCPVSQLKVYGMNQMEAFKMEQRRAAEARGAKSREREEHDKEREKEKEKEKEREAEREKEREVERQAAYAAAMEQQQRRADDERKDRELCELEKLVQEQARRAGIIILEPSECPPDVVRTTIDVEATPAADAPHSAQNNASSTGAGAGAAAPAADSDTTTSSSSTYTAPAGPRTDSSESIYAFITRRLNALEGNSTLIARYIDEQAKALRAALTRAEARWEVSRTLAAKEDDARWEAERMRNEDRLGRILSRVEAMRSSIELERRLTERQLRVLADELGFERRKSFAQLVILVVAIVLGVLSRGDSINALLRTLAHEGRQRPRTNRHQKRLSTGPLAGLLIDVAPSQASTSTPSTPTASAQSHNSTHLSYSLPSQRATAKPRRPLTPLSSIRRRAAPARSFSAEPDPEPRGGELEDLPSPLRGQRRRIARSAHLHPIRRRGDESSDAAEGQYLSRAREFNGTSLPFEPARLSIATARPYHSLQPSPNTPTSFPSASPAAAAAAVAAVKAGRTVAPEDEITEEDGASAPNSAGESASEVEDAVGRLERERVRHAMRVMAATGRMSEDETLSVRSGRSVPTVKPGIYESIT